MRLLDRWIGIPICLLLSLIDRLWPRRRAATSGPLRKLLLIQLAEMGSVVLAEPAMRRARDVHGAELHFLIFASARGSLGFVGGIDDTRVFALRADRLLTLFSDSLRFVRWSRQRGIDMVVDLEPFTRFSAVLAWLTPAGRRAGFHRRADEGLWRGDLFDCRVDYQPQRHMSLNFIALVEAAFGGSAAPDTLPVPGARPVAARERIRVGRRLELRCPGYRRGGRYLLVNPHVGDLLPQRRWPAQRVIELVRQVLVRHADLHVFLTGGEAERAATEALAAAIGDSRCASVAGCFDLAELPALFAAASLLVSSDSGPAHFAATSSLPVIVLFGPETPTLYRPLGAATVLYAGLPCSPCVSAANQRHSGCRDNRCMQAIGVAEVLAAAAPILEWKAAPVRRAGGGE